MRIVYDARTIRPGATGVGGYARELLRGLMRIDRENQYLCLLLDGAEPWDALDAPENFQPRVVRADYERHPAGDLWEHFALPRLLREWRADLVHGPAYHIPWRGSCRRVVTIHDLIAFTQPQTYPFRFRRYMQWLVRRAARRAHGILADSESTRRDLIERLRIAPEKIRTVHLAAGAEFKPQAAEDLERYRARRNLPPDYLLFVGAVEPRKGLDLLLDAHRRLREAGRTDRPLVVAGAYAWKSGELRARLEREKESGAVIRLGYVDDAELPLLYGGARALAFPSLYEGFGLPPLEAMACGVPVVASDVSSLPEVVGDAGLLLPPRDLDAWTAALSRVLEDDALARELSAKGRTRAAQFTWEKTARQTLDFYTSVACS